MLRLQPYHPVIKFQKGSTNPADYLSRHPLSLKSRPIHENIAEEYINFVATHAVPAALSEEDVLRATLDDPTLDAVKKLHSSNKWYLIKNSNNFQEDVSMEDLASFSKVCREISVTHDGLVLRGTRIVIPADLQLRTIQLAHEGHQGVNARHVRLHMTLSRESRYAWLNCLRDPGKISV